MLEQLRKLKWLHVMEQIPGDIKIVDANNDTLLNDADKRIYNKSPKFIISLNNTISYKQFALSVTDLCTCRSMDPV